jgi:hypothetical protein
MKMCREPRNIKRLTVSVKGSSPSILGTVMPAFFQKGEQRLYGSQGRAFNLSGIQEHNKNENWVFHEAAVKSSVSYRTAFHH